MSYIAPALLQDTDAIEYEESGLTFVAAIGWVLLVFGSAWAYCQAVCGWMNVKSCQTSWLSVTAVCK